MTYISLNEYFCSFPLLRKNIHARCNIYNKSCFLEDVEYYTTAITLQYCLPCLGDCTWDSC